MTRITDKQRLDWLTTNNFDLSFLGVALTPTWHVDSEVPEYSSGHIGKSPRAAIDAAIRAAQRADKKGKRK